MGLDIFILVVFQVLAAFNRPQTPLPLIPSANMKRWKEEQPMRSLTRHQDIPRFALHGRYYTEFLSQHSWLIDITTVSMSGSHHRLGVRAPLLSNTSLRYLESPIEQNSTTILQVCTSLILSVAERTSCRVVATMRDPITFETVDKRKDPKSIRWEKLGQ